MSTLSDAAILDYKHSGSIVIEPFHRDHLSTSSYDVCLGSWYYREVKPCKTSFLEEYLRIPQIHNPYDEASVVRVWGSPCEATALKEQISEPLVNISPDDKVIMIGPGETILAHTNEFIGGRDTVTTMMKARSSIGRNFLEVCKCAGWGDIGYINRWTMEITNNSEFHTIPLVVGRRIAQIVFFDTIGTIDKESYETKGKYQTSSCLETLMKNWKPSDMLPKMYKEIKSDT